MKAAEIAHRRLFSQQIAATGLARPEEIVAHLGAMQAQDYPGGLWAIGLRLPGSTKAEIERAIAARKIVRTWPMRGTLHFVAAPDVRWMLKLLAPRALAATAGRRLGLEIDDAVLAHSRKVLTRALAGGQELTRAELYDVLARGGIEPTGQRGIHIFRHLSQEGLLCFGLHAEKQPTFVLLEEWLPATPERSREEAIAELTRRYFVSHGPAQLADFVWWSGLTTGDARKGLALAGGDLESAVCEGKTYWWGAGAEVSKRKAGTYLLPGFDEYMLGYRDRSAALLLEHNERIVPGGNGMFFSTVVSDGQVIGTWKRTARKAGTVLALEYFDGSIPAKQAGLDATVRRYGEFLGASVTLQDG